MNAHDCSACHGSGTAREPNIAPTYDERWRCPVCLGSGRISDVRTARDAMVDAETLRRYVYGHAINSFLRADIHDAAEEGIRSLLAVDDDPRWQYVYARIAARAAFRAVPALREDRQ